MAEKKSLVFSPFITRIDAPQKSDFDKYYYDVQEKEVFKRTSIDSDGDELGIIEKRFLVKKIDIAEFLESQRDSVGIESYMRALAVQGDSIENYNTIVNDKVDDYSQFPDTLAEVLTAGDKAREAFAHLDPALKGDHTTLEGFLNSLTKETIDSYIKGKVDAAFPRQEVEAGGDK